MYQPLFLSRLPAKALSLPSYVPATVLVCLLSQSADLTLLSRPASPVQQFCVYAYLSHHQSLHLFSVSVFAVCNSQIIIGCKDKWMKRKIARMNDRIMDVWQEAQKNFANDGMTCAFIFIYNDTDILYHTDKWIRWKDNMQVNGQNKEHSDEQMCGKKKKEGKTTCTPKSCDIQPLS